jgi:hypothetical protein
VPVAAFSFLIAVMAPVSVLTGVVHSPHTLFHDYLHCDSSSLKNSHQIRGAFPVYKYKTFGCAFTSVEDSLQVGTCGYR